MAIVCAKCGRQYDVTLFQFGRTINCACGARVGFEHRVEMPPGSGLRFFVDVGAARLVRWLRALGIDAIWEDAVSDADLVRRAVEEKRFVLTLDKRMTNEWLVDNVLLLKSEKPFEQFRQIVEHFRIEKPKELFTRCLVCNMPLRRATDEEIGSGAPEHVLETQKAFDFCPACHKLYWHGSHTERMRKEIEAVFDEVRSEK